MTLRLECLGEFRLRDADGEELPLRSRKGRALLAVLALAAPQPVSRERLVGMLWGDDPEDRARHSLRQTLSVLRRLAPSVIAARSDQLSIDPQACAIDLLEFRRMAAGPEPERMHAAIELYRRLPVDTLRIGDGVFDDWLELESERLGRLATDAAGRLSAARMRTGDHATAIVSIDRWLDLDASCEDAHRMRIEALAALGRDSAALQHFETCRQVLLRELGVEPSAQTIALAESIRSGRQSADALAHSCALVTKLPAPEPAHPAIAILPFATHRADAAREDAGRLITSELTALMARVPGFTVVAWQAAAAAQAACPDPKSIGAALSVDYLVAGGLRRSMHGELRIDLELIETSAGRHLWNTRLDCPLPATPAETDELAASLAAQLEPQLNLAELRRASPRSDGPGHAWTMLRRAKAALFARGWSEFAVEEALASFRKSIEADPALALPYAYKALILAIAWRMRLVGDEALREEALRDAEHALRLDSRDSEVLGLAGCALADLGDAMRAHPVLERAVEENPANPQAWAALGACQLMLARIDQGVESLRRGLRAGPSDYRRSVWLTLLAGALMRLREQTESIETAQAACRSDPNFYPARIVLACTLLRAGRDDQASRALAQARRLRPSMRLEELQAWVGRRGQRDLAALWKR